jgi:hypothetical protein
MTTAGRPARHQTPQVVTATVAHPRPARPRAMPTLPRSVKLAGATLLAAGLYWSVMQRNHLPEAATASDCLLFTSLVFGGYLSRPTTNLITRRLDLRLELHIHGRALPAPASLWATLSTLTYGAALLLVATRIAPTLQPATLHTRSAHLIVPIYLAGTLTITTAWLMPVLHAVSGWARSRRRASL